MLTLLAFISFLFVVLQGAVLSPVKPVYDLDYALDHFIEFVKKYDKVYQHGEAAKRFENFVLTLGHINERNQNDTAVHNINNFADMSSEEFSMKMLGAKFVENLPPPEPYEREFTAPTEVDWRFKNMVAPVKNQGDCGSCWAFAAVATIETQYAKLTGTVIEFSEQQILDCDPQSRGCAGGSPVQAMQYLQAVRGLNTELDYPYLMGHKSTCLYQPSRALAKVTSSSISEMTEETMADLVANYGPISVIICSLGLRTYDGTVWSGPYCPGRTLKTCIDAAGNPKSHAVTIVGYGTYQGLKYWLVKNSWGPNWGENGYFRMLRGAGTCLVNKNVAIATVAIV